MASAKPRIHCRRCLRGPSLFLALWAVLLCSAPAVAAERTNPAGTTITKNPGMEATADGDRLTNLGTIKPTDSSVSLVGMGSSDLINPNSDLILTNHGVIEAAQTGDYDTFAMLGGDNSTLANHGSITVITTGNAVNAHGMDGGAGSTLVNSGTIAVSATNLATLSGMWGGDNSTLASSGVITATASNGQALGMYASDSASLTNSGTITASATGNSGQAHGMWGGAGSTLINSGSIQANGTEKAYGMTGGDNSSLDNTKTIRSTATGNNGIAYGMYGDAGAKLANSGIITATAAGTGSIAYGMFAEGDNSTLINSGAITATTATGEAYGMYSAGANSTLTNSGAISASATGRDSIAIGMYGSTSSLDNSGTITASATGNNGYAFGMWGGDNSTLANSGTITASGVSGAYGMQGVTNSTLVNSGTITAIVNGDIGYAYGVKGSDHSTLANSGAITAIATNATGEARGMEGFADNVSLANSGTITAIVTTATGKAHGMALYSGTAANYGLVSAIAANPANAWEVYGTGDDTTTVSITNWATDLRDFTTYKFFGSRGTTLDLTGSRLTLRPGAPERGFAWGREYAVASMIDGNHGQGAVASVTQEVPWVRARLTGTDWTDQKLSLHPNFTRKTNIGQGVASQGIALILDQARGLEHGIDGQRSQNSSTAPIVVAGSGPAAFSTASAPDSGWSGFLTPYYSYVDNSDLEYDAKIAGFMAGATRRFSDAFAAGVHLGFSHADVSADLADQDGEALTGLLGLHAIYNATPEWYLRGQLTGFISRASNDWESGLPVYPLSTDADINSRGLYASLATGYDWRINASNTITPEIGLSWLWSHQDSFSLNWKDRFGNHLDNYDLDYKAQDYNALYGTAMVRWRGSFDLAGGSFQPALGVGVRQVLTDGDVKSRLTTAGSSFSTKATEDETTALAEAGFVWQRGITSVGLTYTGGYGDDQVVHTGWLTLKLEF